VDDSRPNMNREPKGNREHNESQDDPRDVSSAWDSDNQAWWDWYVGLAHNEERAGPAVDVPPVLLEPNPEDTAALGYDALAEELAKPYPLREGDIHDFRALGYIKLPRVLSDAAVATLRREIVTTLEADYNVSLDRPVTNDSGTYTKAGSRFYSAEMVWLSNPIIRLFVLSPRIAEISAHLLGVERVRLYHDNLMSKEPGCGRTPWHFDDHHFPLATQDVVTAWIPGQAIPEAMGPLTFARGIDAWRAVEEIPFNKVDTSYDQQVARTFQDAKIPVDASAFNAGDVSFHHNLNFHSAGANLTSISRCVLANTLFADGARVVDAPTMVSGDWKKFLPGVDAGAIAASPLNPVCWPPSTAWPNIDVPNIENGTENG